jgi:hypothetical protein
LAGAPLRVRELPPGGAYLRLPLAPPTARFVDETTLAGWLEALPDACYRSRDARRLARTLLRTGMAKAAVRLLDRRRRAGRSEPNTLLLSGAAVVLARRGRA